MKSRETNTISNIISSALEDIEELKEKQLVSGNQVKVHTFTAELDNVSGLNTYLLTLTPSTPSGCMPIISISNNYVPDTSIITEGYDAYAIVPAYSPDSFTWRLACNKRSDTPAELRLQYIGAGVVTLVQED